MARFVLIHGACHGGWCWERLIPHLRAAGHEVAAPDLPGRGDDPRGPDRVTLEDYATRVCETLADGPDPAILVGHSFGGVSISRAAEWMPGRIARLVYVGALLLQDGQSRQSLRRSDRPEEDVSHRLQVDAAAGTVSLRPEFAREGFYNTCTEADAAWATSRLCPEPLGPLGTALSVSETGFGRVPRAYLGGLQDRTVSPRQQRAMLAALPCDPVIDLDTDHSPFLSAPLELARHLMTLA